EFELTEIRKELRTNQEAERISFRDEELVAQSANDKDFAKLIFYLTLARLELASVGNHLLSDSLQTHFFEGLFQAVLDGKLEEFKEALASCRKESCFEFALTQGPSAFLAEQSGDLDMARQLYRAVCVPSRLYSQPVMFNCLMYAALGERAGDRKAALEGYDLV